MVLSYLPIKYLLTCRLVNQTWDAKSLPWIQKKMKTPVYASPEEFQKFCADFDCTDVLPFESLKIVLQGTNKDDCHKFFTQHGSKLRTLKIHEYKSAEGPDESALQESVKKLQYIFRHVPNLKTLDLNFEYLPNLIPGLFDFEEGESVTLTHVEDLKLRWTGSRRVKSSGFLPGLVTLLPILKVIDFEIPDIFRNEQDLEIFGNSLGQRLSLDTIRLRGCSELHGLFRVMTTQGLPKLKELEMPLEIRLNSYNNDPLRIVEAQEDFLRSQSDNLEVLRLTIAYDDLYRNSPDQQKRQFPVLRNLKTAAFVNNGGHCIEYSFPYLPLQPEHLPKLKSLCVVPKTMESEIFADSIFHSVEEVILSRWGHMDSGLLHKIGSRFPNLRKLSKLEISVDVNAMATIVSNFPNIENLKLKFFDRRGEYIQNFNLVISGVPANKWHLAHGQLAACRRSGNEPLLTCIPPPGPSLRDLKCLKRLVMELECRPFPQKIPRFARIDEIGVYLTFLRLSPQLNLTFRGTFSISHELAAKLTGHYQNFYFIPSAPEEVE